MMTKEERQNIIDTFKISEHDTGSMQVQIALLTKRIESLKSHFKTNIHDFSSMRGLKQMIARRRKSLDYLKRTDHSAYKKMLEALNLRK